MRFIVKKLAKNWRNFKVFIFLDSNLRKVYLVATTMPTPTRNRTVVLIVDAVIALVCVVGLYHVSQKAGIPIVLDEEEGSILCIDVPDPMYQHYIKPGEYIRAVGGIEVQHMEDVEFLLDARRIGESVDFLIDDGIDRRTVSIPLTSFYEFFYLIVASMVGLLFYLMGLFVYLRRPKDTAAILFHWASMCTVLMILTTWGRYTIDPVEVGIGLRAVFFLAHAFLSIIFFHFTLEFPRPKWNIVRKNIGYLYSIALGLALWTIVIFFRAVRTLSPDAFGESLLAFFISRWFLVGFGLLGLLSIAHSYYTAVEEFERKKLRWVLWGLFIGFPPYLLLWVIPQIVIKQGIVREEVVTLFSVFIPITFAISIVRYRLMDIDLIINRSIVYGLVMSVVFGVYASIVGLSALLVTRFTVEFSVLISAVAAVVIAIVFTPVRDSVQRFVDKKFFRVRYNFREVQRRFVEEMRNAFDVRQLASVMVDRIDELFALERVGLFLIKGEGRRLQLLAHKHYDLLEMHGVRFEADQLKASFRVPVALPETVEHGVPIEHADARVFGRWGMALVFAMVSEQKDILGFLVLGAKRSGARFTAEDVDLLTTVSTQAGLAIERIRLQQKLLLEHEQRQRLEELNRLKSYFVSSVSHDLKTPLTSIKVFAEMLQAKKISRRKMMEYLEIIQGESDRLTRLISNVLDFAKVERGVMEYQFSDVMLNDVVQQGLRSIAYQLKMQGCRLKTKLTKQNSKIQADEDAVVEAMVNLLSNAMKYSPKKKKITVSTFRRNGFAAVRIEDKGIGIARRDLDNIFEPFYRSKDGNVRQVGGAGLGLAMVKHTMEAHGGKVEVRSAVGKGSSFTLLFPLVARSRSRT
jgi:signal transduction histidine kinase